MAAIESIGFTLWVQPARLRFVPIARSVPWRVAHPPPSFRPTESVCPPHRLSFASRTCASAHLSTSERAATSPLKGRLVMEKAHLYEALYLVNHGIDEAIRGVQRLKKPPKLFMEAYHKSMAGLERRRSIINLQFMLEMRKVEEDDESRFEEEYNFWLSDEPLTNDEICQLMRVVERARKLEGKPPLVQFLPRSKRPKKTPKKTEGVHSSRKLNGPMPSAPGVESTVPEDAHA
jgi:hypothetical protein